MNHALPLDLLVCPDCHKPLSEENGALVCTACGERFKIDRDVTNLIPSTLRNKLNDSGGDPSWDRWREAIRGLESWRANRAANAKNGVLPSDGADDGNIRALFRRAKIEGGTVLDVGCKDGSRASLLPAGVKYVGIDPFAQRSHVLPDQAVIVRGVAEALPIRDRSVDAVISLAAFDYFANGEGALDQMLRVLKPGGPLALMVSTVSGTVARARGGRTKQSRVASALQAVKEVGMTAGAGLVGAALFERDRPHTHYYTQAQCTSLVGRKFDIEDVTESAQSASTILYITARKRRQNKLPIVK